MSFLTTFFCSLVTVCATLVIKSENPIFSVLYLILTFFNASALVLLLGHDYMAALFVVLYVGAMCTFFLFTIMILDIQTEGDRQKSLIEVPINILVTIALTFVCRNLLDFRLSSPSEDAQASSQIVDSIRLLDISPLEAVLLDTGTQIYSLGGILYTSQAWLLIVASLILLNAMLGSIVLTLNKKADAKTQLVHKQNLRDFRRLVTKYQ